MLQDDAVAIRVFLCSASRFPVWIEGRDLFETGGQHARTCRLPLGCRRDVENQQVFGRRRWHNRMGATVRELEVVARTFEPSPVILLCIVAITLGAAKAPPPDY